MPRIPPIRRTHNYSPGEAREVGNLINALQEVVDQKDARQVCSALADVLTVCMTLYSGGPVRLNKMVDTLTLHIRTEGEKMLRGKRHMGMELYTPPSNDDYEDARTTGIIH